MSATFGRLNGVSVATALPGSKFCVGAGVGGAAPPDPPEPPQAESTSAAAAMSAPREVARVLPMVHLPAREDLAGGAGACDDSAHPPRRSDCADLRRYAQRGPFACALRSCRTTVRGSRAGQRAGSVQCCAPVNGPVVSGPGPTPVPSSAREVLTSSETGWNNGSAGTCDHSS